MGNLRVLAFLIFAVFLAGCAAHIPVFETGDNAPVLDEIQDDVPGTAVQSDRTPTAKAVSEAKKKKPSAPKRATASTNVEPANPTTPAVALGQWEKERAEEARKDQKLKQVIEGICRGC